MNIHPWVDSIKKLSCVKRFSQTELAKPENVLEHCGMVAMISLHIATALQFQGCVVDVQSVLTKALLHDIEESELGDISKPSKYSSSKLRELIGELEKTTAEKILYPLDEPGYLYHNWETAKVGPCGAIVSFVDTFCALLKFHDEIVVRGNRSMVPILSPTAFQTLFEKLDVLVELFGKEVPVIREYITASANIQAGIAQAQQHWR